MAETLLFEIGTEEIPAKFMPDTLEQFKKISEDKLKENRIKFESIKTLGTPRRLVLLVEGVQEKQDSVNQKVKGPAKKIAYDENGQLSKAALGFMKSQRASEKDISLEKIGEIEYIFATKFEEGKGTKEILTWVLPEIINSIKFPKSMRWRDYAIKFARPIRWIVALLGKEIVNFSIEGASASNITKGHRTFSNYDIVIDSADQYIRKLLDEHIIVDPAERKNIILTQIKELAALKNGRVLIDDELLEEVIYLVEYPTALIGGFEEEFLALIKEVIITPMKEHQRYFPVLDNDGKRLLPYFITIRNGGKENIDIVRQGNERVLRARLKDAQFFYNEDMKERLEDRVEKLKIVVYQEKLGTIYEKIERIKGLAEKIGKMIDLDKGKIDKLSRTALLCKADLETAMVYEFAELQGIMGREYALKNGEDKEVAEAIYSHYLPRFSGDETPENVIGQIISISDKIDTIVGSFGIGVQPTGSQDPYGLRRQALGIISVLMESGLDISINQLISVSIELLKEKITEKTDVIQQQTIEFFKQRLRVMLIDKGWRYDIVDSVLEKGILNVKDMVKRIEDISYVRENGGQNYIRLLTALNRVYSLASKAENRCNKVDVNKFENKYEQELYKIISEVKNITKEMVEQKSYRSALESMYQLVNPINEFFDNTMIIVDNNDLKNNRLAMLVEIREIGNYLCDFSKIID